MPGERAELTVHEKAERLRMALAEAGYPDRRLVTEHVDEPTVALGRDGVPDEVCWRAFAIVDPEGTCCWACWQTGDGEDCEHGVYADA